LICISVSEIFDPQAKHALVLGGETFVGNHRGKMFLVVGHQVCTSVGISVHSSLQILTLRKKILTVSCLSYGDSKFQLPPQIFYRIKVWRLARPLHDLNVFLLEPLLCCLSGMFWVIVMLEGPSTTHLLCFGWWRSKIWWYMVHQPLNTIQYSEVVQYLYQRNCPKAWCFHLRAWL